MIIDFHTHIFPRDIRENRHKHFATEPSFKLLYQSAKSRLIGANQLIDAMDQNRVDKSVIFGFPWKNSAIFKPHNDYIIEMDADFSHNPKDLIRLYEKCGHPALPD